MKKKSVRMGAIDQMAQIAVVVTMGLMACSTPVVENQPDFMEGKQKKRHFQQDFLEKMLPVENLFVADFLKKTLEKLSPHQSFAVFLTQPIQQKSLFVIIEEKPGDKTLVFTEDLLKKIAFESELAAFLALQLAIWQAPTLEKLAVTCPHPALKCVLFFYENRTFLELKPFFAAALEMTYAAGYDVRGFMSLVQLWEKEPLIALFSSKVLPGCVEYLNQELGFFPPLRHPIVRSNAFLELLDHVK